MTEESAEYQTHPLAPRDAGLALSRALILLAEEIVNPPKTAINPHFKSKFAPLDELLTYVRPLLAKHGIVMVQTADVGPHGPVLVTHIMHRDGASMISRYPLQPVKNDPQGMGAAVTYARRYALCAILGIAGDDDNDATSTGKSDLDTGENRTRKTKLTPEQSTALGEVRASLRKDTAPELLEEAEADFKRVWNLTAYSSYEKMHSELTGVVNNWRARTVNHNAKKAGS